MGDGDHVEGVVQAPVSSSGEAVANLLAGGGVDRGGAVVGREPVFGLEAFGLSDLGQDPGRQDGANAVDRDESGPGGRHRMGEFAVELLDAPIEGADVVKMVHGDLATDPTRLGLRA